MLQWIDKIAQFHLNAMAHYANVKRILYLMQLKN